MDTYWSEPNKTSQHSESIQFSNRLSTVFSMNKFKLPKIPQINGITIELCKRTIRQLYHN